MNPGTHELSTEEAGHAVRVLRMKEGDSLTLTDGKGGFYEAQITLASPKHCQFDIQKQWNDTKLWNGGIHLAVAPTKNMDRMEWLAEKATEIEKIISNKEAILNDAREKAQTLINEATEHTSE